MHHVYLSLLGHPDITRLELEDGLIRGAVAELISTPSTISTIIVDMPRERAMNGAAEAEAMPLAPAVIINAEDEADATIEIADLIAEVAVVEAQAPVKVHYVVDQVGTWAGSVTPGVKVRLALRSAAGIDQPSFKTWVSDAVQTAVERLDSAQLVTVVEPLEPVDGLPNAFASFVLPNDESLDAALSAGAFDSLLGSELIDLSRTRISAVSEHRIAPNPNTWTD